MWSIPYITTTLTIWLLKRRSALIFIRTELTNMQLLIVELSWTTNAHLICLDRPRITFLAPNKTTCLETCWFWIHSFLNKIFFEFEHFVVTVFKLKHFIKINVIHLILKIRYTNYSIAYCFIEYSFIAVDPDVLSKLRLRVFTVNNLNKIIIDNESNISSHVRYRERMVWEQTSCTKTCQLLVRGKHRIV